MARLAYSETQERPAFRTSRSMPPSQLSAASCTIARTSSSCVTSVGDSSTPAAPRCRHSTRTSSSSCVLLAARISRHPFAAYCSASSFPIPELAPVISTRNPRYELIGCFLLPSLLLTPSTTAKKATTPTNQYKSIQQSDSIIQKDKKETKRKLVWILWINEKKEEKERECTGFRIIRQTGLYFF